MTAHVAVVGGGISGLAAAHRLRTLLGPSAVITLLEQRDRLGGVLRTVDLAGVPYDVGAEAFLARRPELPALLAELGLTEQLMHPTAATATIRAAGRTRPLPAGTLLGVPTSAARLDALLSPAGVAQVVTERVRPLRWNAGSDVALGGLLRERFGDELPDRLVDPLLGGVYASRIDTLGLRATIPALAAALDAGAPSLTAAADRATAATTRSALTPASRGLDPRESGPERARVGVSVRASRVGTSEVPRASVPVFGAVRGGYQVLLDALVLASGAEVRLDTTVRELRRKACGWRLTLGPTTAPESLDVDAVLLAVPAPAASRLLAVPAPEAARAAGGIELASSVVVALAYDASTAPPPTSGTLIAAGEPLSVKGITHSTTKWSHLGADGLVRLRASLGRFGETLALQADDAELVARVRADLVTLEGITAEPLDVYVQRWGGGLPQYGIGHLERVRAFERGLPTGLVAAGAALHGVGVPACVGTGQAAAARLVAALTPSRGR